MSRSGIEKKPPWRDVPTAVRSAVDAALGAHVVRGSRVYGGYAPTPTYRLSLGDGRSAFFKAVNSKSNPFMHTALANELRFYLELQPLVSRWSPALLGWFEAAGWSVLLLEDVGPKSAPPWTPSLARRVVAGFAEFHLASQNALLPDWVDRQSAMIPAIDSDWLWIDDETRIADAASVAGEAAPLMAQWLRREGPRLRAAASRLKDSTLETTLLHLDARSDNLRWRDRQLTLLDWPHILAGAPEFDLAFLLQATAAEGGPQPEALLPSYVRVLPLEPDVLDAAVAAVASFFAVNAWQPELSGLPRLRRWQRKQLRSTLEWAVRRFELAPAPWVTALPDSEPGPSL